MLRYFHLFRLYTFRWWFQTRLGLAALAFLLVVSSSLVAVAVYFQRHDAIYEGAALDVMHGLLPEDPNAPRSNPRLVYPYSVIPGGIATAQDLQAAIERDPVVREHYHGVETAKVHAISLPEAKTAQVSYRVGDRVYWTRKKVNLAKGELVLTDGENLIRARCGNRISEQPQLATLSEEEPPEEALDAALVLPPPTPVEPVASEVEARLGIPPLESERPVAGFFFAPAAKMSWWKPLLIITPALAAAAFLPEDGPAPANLPPATPVPPSGGETTPAPPPPAEPPATEPPSPPVTEPTPPPPAGSTDPPVVEPPPGPEDPQPPTPPNPPDNPPPVQPPTVDPPPVNPPVNPPPPPWQDPNPPTDPPPGPPQEPPVNPPPPPLTPVPEPSFYAVLGVGLLGLLAVAHRRRK